jgi:lysozyme
MINQFKKYLLPYLMTVGKIFSKTARSVAGFIRRLPRPVIFAAVCGLFALIVLGVSLHFYHEASPVVVMGIDVSHYQGVIDWQKVSTDKNVRFAYIKATEGSTYRDPNFTRNWENAAQNGIIAGAYHFFSKKSSGSTQAKNFISTVPKQSGRLCPVVDVESTLLVQNSYKTQLDTFVNLVEAHYGKKPIFYVTNRVYSLLYDDYADYPFWVVDYKGSPKVSEWSFWQYSNKSSIAGISGYVDTDEYHGTLWEFENLLT